jgi:hypothetical protein
MSLEAMESEIAGIRAKAADLADDYARTQAEASADSNLTETGKLDALAPLHEDMTTKVSALLQQEKAVIKSKREALERSLFGASGNSMDIVSYRDAQSIAAQLTDSDEAQAKYTSAVRSNDKVLAQAIFAQSLTRGWSQITDDYTSRNPSAKTALADLDGLKRHEQNPLAAAMHYMTPRLSTARPVMPVGISSGEMNALFTGGGQR